MEKYKQAKVLIAEDKIQDALKILLDEDDNSEIQNTILLLSGQFEGNQKNIQLDIYGKSITDTEHHRIVKALNDLCSQAIQDKINPNKSFVQKIEDRLRNHNFDHTEFKIESPIAFFWKCEKSIFGRTFIVRVSKDDIIDDDLVSNNRLTRAFKFKHRNIIKLLDYQMDENPKYLLLEYIDGVQLSHILGKVPLYKQIALDIAIQLSEALYYMHIHGEFHKNLKPSQILIDHEFKPVISLFEIIENTYDHIDTNRDELLYASPEELNNLDLSPNDKSNQFSLGLVIFELFAGYPLFKSSNKEEDLDLIQSKRKDFNNSQNKQALISRKVKNKNLSKILSKMLSTNPDGRYPSLLEVSDELKRISINLKKKAFVDLVLASYSRCCINNINLVDDFYNLLFSNEHLGNDIKKRFDNYHNLNSDERVVRALEKTRRRKLRMTILLMTGAYENNSIIAKITQFKGHHGLDQIRYYEVFMDCMLEMIMKNDFLWKNYDAQDGNQLKQAWVSMKNVLLEKITKTIELQKHKKHKKASLKSFYPSVSS
jgi:serine/threonine protein kinase